VKVYLDNNVVSAIAKDDTKTESAALLSLWVASAQQRLDLVTSELTLREIQQYNGRARPDVEEVFRSLGKVPVVAWDELRGFHSSGDSRTWLTAPLIQNDVLYDDLLKLGLQTVDAQHVFVAAKQCCAFFLTCDGGVLHRATLIEPLCGVKVRKPSAFMRDLG